MKEGRILLAAMAVREGCGEGGGWRVTRVGRRRRTEQRRDARPGWGVGVGVGRRRPRSAVLVGGPGGGRRAERGRRRRARGREHGRGGASGGCLMFL